MKVEFCDFLHWGSSPRHCIVAVVVNLSLPVDCSLCESMCGLDLDLDSILIWTVGSVLSWFSVLQTSFSCVCSPRAVISSSSDSSGDWMQCCSQACPGSCWVGQSIGVAMDSNGVHHHPHLETTIQTTWPPLSPCLLRRRNGNQTH